MKIGWRIFWHIVFWICGVSFFVFVGHNNSRSGIMHVLIVWALYGAINISLFYLNYLLFIPQFLNKKRYGVYVLVVIITVIFFGIGKYGVALLFEKDILMRFRGEVIGFTPYFISTIFTGIVFLFLSFVLKLGVDWILNERIQRDLENQRLSAELAFFKITDQSSFFV